MHLSRTIPSLRSGPDRERGFTLVELMISVGLSLMILAGLLSVFVNNSNTRKEIERTTRQIENGRYAVELLSGNLMHAGFYAEFDPTLVPVPGALIDACSTAAADISAGLALPIQGYRSATASTAGLSCLTDLKDGTDVVVVRRSSTCVAGTAGCDALTSGAFYYFQASLCNPTTGNAELASADVAQWYRLDSNTANLDRRRRTCMVAGCTCTSPVPLADIRRYHTHIYFVANNSVGSDGVPTLKRAELTGGGFTVVPLVEGIENLKLEYGIDSNGDGMPEAYSPTPDTYNGCAAAACAVTNWRDVTTAKIFLLARNTEPSSGYTDNKTYALGSATPAAATLDAYRRHVFNTTVKLVNVAGRRGI